MCGPGVLVVTWLCAVPVADCDLAMCGQWALLVTLLCAVRADLPVTLLCAVTGLGLWPCYVRSLLLSM